MAKRTLKVMDTSGHTTLTWDPVKAESDEKEMAKLLAAKEVFEDKIKKDHMLAYTLDSKREKGEVVREFDPQSHMVMTPQMQGG